jgi:hypothetical protein
LTKFFIEGSHERALLCQAGLYIHAAREPVTMSIARVRGVLLDARGAADLAPFLSWLAGPAAAERAFWVL